MTKDWNGSENSYSKVSGFSSHTDTAREVNDYYATDPSAVRMLLDIETFGDNIRESAGGVASDHFHPEVKLIQLPKGAQREIDDILLTRLACYQIAMNGNRYTKGNATVHKQEGKE